VTTGNGFEFEDGQINAGAGIVADARQELSGMLNVLRGEVSQNAASWQGTAATAFRQLMERWDSSANLLTTSLDEFEANLRGTDKNYMVMEDEAQQAMTRIQSSLG